MRKNPKKMLEIVLAFFDSKMNCVRRETQVEYDLKLVKHIQNLKYKIKKEFSDIYTTVTDKW